MFVITIYNLNIFKLRSIYKILNEPFLFAAQIFFITVNKK